MSIDKRLMALQRATIPHERVVADGIRVSQPEAADRLWESREATVRRVAEFLKEYPLTDHG